MSERSSYTDSFPKGVGQPAIRALTGAGYTEWKQLSGASQSELLKLHGFGPKAIALIRAAFEDAGLEGFKP